MIRTKQALHHFFEEREKLGIKPGLDRVMALLEAAGHPEQTVKAVHVAGTNGKGSVIQFMQEACIQNGYRVGVFTSPSFIGIQGHFLINGHAADAVSIIEQVNLLLPGIKALDEQDNAPTSFEIITVVAFMYFSGRTDIALIETGMGGRFDTTNVFRPLLSVITNIAIDHTTFLGSSFKEIAFHKAGIIKQEVPVVTGELNQEALKVIEQEALEKSAPIYRLGTHYHLHQSVYAWKDQNVKPVMLSSGLLGEHQLKNAAIAFSALLLLGRSGFLLRQEVILQAFTDTRLPGRFEAIHTHPLIILDSAHNLAGIRAFLETVDQTSHLHDKKLLFAGFKDKQLKQMVKAVNKAFNEITVTTFHHKRAASVALLHSLHTESNIQATWKEAIDAMLRDTESNTHYYITGSLYFITLVRSYILAKTN